MDGAHSHGHGGGGIGLGEIAILVAAVFVVTGGMDAAVRIVTDLLTIVIIALSTVVVLVIAAVVSIAVVRSRRQDIPAAPAAQPVTYRVTSLGQQPQRTALPQASPLAQFSDDETQILLAVAEAIAAKRRR